MVTGTLGMASSTFPGKEVLLSRQRSPGSRHNLSLLGGRGPSLLGDDVIEPSDHVRLLGVTIAVLASPAETCSSLFGH